MKRQESKSTRAASVMRPDECGRVPTSLLLVVCFILGLGAGAYWYQHSTRSNANSGNDPASSAQLAVALSETAKADLGRLDSPVEIRFYSSASPGALPESLQPFATRVLELVSAYQRETDGKIHVTRLDPQSDPKAETLARSDGVKPMPLQTGDFYYLGLAVAFRNQKEIISPLNPEWEPALPSDLSRAILRLIAGRAAASPSANPAATDPVVAKETLQEVVRTIPNLASVSLEDGTRILREAALAQAKAAVDELQAQVSAAQQKLAETRNGKSEAAQQAALRQLQQVQNDQTEKLQQITQRLHDQIAALKQLKATPP